MRWSLVPARKPVDEACPVLHVPEVGLDQRGQLAEVAFYQVGPESLQQRPDGLDGVEFGGVGRELEDCQPVPGRDQAAHRLADMGVQVCPRPG